MARDNKYKINKKKWTLIDDDVLENQYFNGRTERKKKYTILARFPL